MTQSDVYEGITTAFFPSKKIVVQVVCSTYKSVQARKQRLNDISFSHPLHTYKSLQKGTKKGHKKFGVQCSI